MQITDVKVRKLFNDDGPMKAIVSVTFDGQLALHDIKVIYARGGTGAGCSGRGDSRNARNRRKRLILISRKRTRMRVLFSFGFPLFGQTAAHQEHPVQKEHIDLRSEQ